MALAQIDRAQLPITPPVGVPTMVTSGRQRNAFHWLDQAANWAMLPALVVSAIGLALSIQLLYLIGVVVVGIVTLAKGVGATAKSRGELRA